MAKSNGKHKKRGSYSSERRSKKRISKASRPSTSYRETTRELLKTFPELPTGPSGRRRPSSDELPAQQPQPSEPGPARSQEALEIEPDTHAGDMEHEDDYHSCDDGDGIFSGNSCGSVADLTDEEMVDMPQNKSGNLIDLPSRIWGKILALLEPVELAQLRTCGRFFDNLLKQDTIWRVSRNNYLPELPKPVLGLSELEMFQLLFGTRCMLCESQKDIRTYWPFRIKCCKQCLSDNTTKEFSLRSGSNPYPEELSDALAFGMVDVKDNWIPSPISYQPNIGITKIYWNKDLDSMRDRYQEAKEMLAADEWLKGLESERDSQMQDIERIERFEKTRSTDMAGVNILWRHLRASEAADSVSENMQGAENGTAPERDGHDKLLKATKQQEIEERCLKLNPPLKLEKLVHLPAYQASMKDDKPLNEESWESLKNSLLKERSDTGEQKPDIEEPISVSRNGRERSREGAGSRPSISKAWDEAESVQLSNRAKLAAHAQEVICKWDGNLSAETVPKFSAEVLRYCRKQFLADESTRRKRLTLDDMKYVFDMKIKPLAHPHRVEIFLCNGCPNNPRWWGFESLVQHFTAKHTYNPRGRPAKVNWRADWPDIGPFRSDPERTQPEVPVGAHADTLSSPHSTRAPPRPREHPRSASPPNWTQGFNRSVPTAPRHGYKSSSKDESRYGRLDQLAGDARDAWFQLAKIRDIPSSVLIHFVITRTARKYQTRRSEAIPLSLFLEALSEHPAMTPIRAANGLGCIECQRHPGRVVDGTSKADRLFPIISLLQHFETVHVKRSKSAVAPDWTRDMVRLPHPRVILALADSEGVDTEKRHLLEDIFPWAFVKSVKHERVRSTDGGTKARSDAGSGRGSVFPSGPRHSESSMIRAPQSTSERDATMANGFPISQDRLQQIEFVDPHGNFNSFDAPDRTFDYRPTRRDVSLHDRHQSATTDMARMDSIGPGSPRPIKTTASSSYYSDQRDQYKFQGSARQEGNHQPDTRRRASRPSAADFMDAQARAPRPAEANYHDDPHFGHNFDPARHPPTGSARRRSRSPVRGDLNGDRYRERYPPPGPENRGIPVGYPGPRYAYPPTAYYGSAEIGEYHDPYRSRPPHGYYAAPPPPLVIPHPDYYYDAQAVRSGSPSASARYPAPPPHLPMADRPPPNDGYDTYRRY